MERSLLVALVAVLAVLVAGYVILADRGRDVSSYAIFLGGPLVSSIVGVILTRRVAEVQATAARIDHQTNSLLTAHLDIIGDKLDRAAGNLAVQPDPGQSEPHTA